MEFYHSRKEAQDRKGKFQFPTGWNSTDPNTRLPGKNQVSIPNGMEFYMRWAYTFFQEDFSFNSQRDGILPMPYSAETNVVTSFNSQRDGILLSWKFCILSISSVSIPNGMEFYVSDISFLDIQRLWFQFPTGWNSTRLTPAQIANGESFNSQRDGILRKW